MPDQSSSQAAHLARREEEMHDAERAVLGAMLRHNACIDEVSAILDVEDFYSDAHQKLCEAITAFHGQGGRPVDRVILRDELSRRGWLEDVGGSFALEVLWSAGASSANVAHHAAIVRDRSSARKVGFAGQEMARLAASGMPAEELAEEAERLVFAATRRAARKEPRQIDRVLDSWAEGLQRNVAAGSPRCVPAACGDLDQIVPGFFAGELVLIAARPSVGKTSVGMHIAKGAAMGGAGVLVVSLEMSGEELAERMVASESGVNSQRLRMGQVDAAQFQGAMEAGGRLSAMTMWVDDAPVQTARHIAAVARRHKARHGLDLLLVDYIQLVRPDDPKRPQHEQLTQIATDLKAMARNFSCAVVAMAQLNRDSENRGGDGRPRMSDLKGSGGLEQAADTVVLLHRPDITRQLLVQIVDKQRHGPTGDASAFFDRATMRFSAEEHPARDRDTEDVFR